MSIVLFLYWSIKYIHKNCYWSVIIPSFIPIPICQFSIIFVHHSLSFIFIHCTNMPSPSYAYLHFLFQVSSGSSFYSFSSFLYYMPVAFSVRNLSCSRDLSFLYLFNILCLSIVPKRCVSILCSTACW